MKKYSFTKVVTDVTSKFRKIKASGYKEKGRFRIIDQGKKTIAGYTNDESLINKTHSPVIIFGDHTRILKYEDSPIALGADGAKALTVDNTVADPLYVYYYLRSINLKDAGYSRHFKYLKRVQIPIPEMNGKPNLNDQKRIALLLGKVEGLISQRKQHMQLLDDLLKSVFLEMFGDPVRNEKGWDKPKLKQFGKISTGNTPPRKDPSNYSSQYIEWIKTNNISANSFFISQATEYLSETGATKARTVTKGALMVACIAGSVKSIGRAAITDRKVAFNQQINAIQPKKDVNPLFLYVLFQISKMYIQSYASKGMKKILSKGDFEKITMIKPPINLQNQFATIVEKVQGLKSRYQQSLTDLESLYGALSQKAFKGELDLSRVILPVEPTSEVTDSTEDSNPETREMNDGTFDLPAPGDPKALKSKGGRKALINMWIKAWVKQLGDASFTAQAFMAAAQQRLWELAEDDVPEWGVGEYDELKAWVFKALQQETLIQRYDDSKNHVQITSAME